MANDAPNNATSSKLPKCEDTTTKNIEGTLKNTFAKKARIKLLILSSLKMAKIGNTLFFYILRSAH